MALSVCCSVMLMGVSHFDKGLFNTVSGHNQLLGALFVLTIEEGSEGSTGPIPGASLVWLC